MRRLRHQLLAEPRLHQLPALRELQHHCDEGGAVVTETRATILELYATAAPLMRRLDIAKFELRHVFHGCGEPPKDVPALKAEIVECAKGLAWIDARLAELGVK